MEASVMPTVYVPHGGGPWPFVHQPWGGKEQWQQMEAYMKRLGTLPPTKPRAVLLVSAHWEEAHPTVSTSKNPPLLFDYYGFPPEAYELTWPAPGAPGVAHEVQQLLEAAGIASDANPERGFDHATFVPLKLAYPEADVPTVQLSLKKGLDPREHLAVGRALRPLRNSGVFIVGSGMSYHNMRGFMANLRGGGSPALAASKRFDDWLFEAVTTNAERREQMLIDWEHAPEARACHPREEHLMPLHVVAGAAGSDRASVPYRDVVMGTHVSAVHFG